MPVSLSSLLDMLLIAAGLILVVTGLVMFIRSKTASAASSVEAFGIKLNVTHPSLILVLAGVGLMLAPRLLPGLPGEAGEKPAPAVVAEAQAPVPAPADAVPPLPDKPGTPGTPRTPLPAAPAAADTRPSAPPAAPAAARPATPRLAVATAVDKPPAPAANASQPTPAPAPVAAIAPAPKPARPALVVASLGLPSTHGFWSGETQSSYTRRLQSSLLQASQDVLRMNTQDLSLSPREFDAWWNESSDHPRSRVLCASRSAPVALLSARVENTLPHASIESANWPELNVRLYLCDQHRVYRQRRGLSPLNADAWPFSTELNAEIERFLRAYRDDLRS